MIDFIRYVLNYSEARRERAKKAEWQLVAYHDGCTLTDTETQHKSNVIVTCSINGYGERKVQVTVPGKGEFYTKWAKQIPLIVKCLMWEKGGPLPQHMSIASSQPMRDLVNRLVDEEMGL